MKKEVPKAAKWYEEELREEINEDREKHGKKPFSNNDKKPPRTKETTESTTDPESGVFHKGEHKKCFAYTAQTTCDKYGYILDFTLHAGNIHDSVAFDALYARLKEKFPQMHDIVMDCGYKTPWICKQVLDNERVLVLLYKRPMGKKVFFHPMDMCMMRIMIVYSALKIMFYSMPQQTERGTGSSKVTLVAVKTVHQKASAQRVKNVRKWLPDISGQIILSWWKISVIQQT